MQSSTRRSDFSHPLTFDTDHQFTVGVCVDMAPTRRGATVHFGPCKNISIIERQPGAHTYDAKSVCAKQRPVARLGTSQGKSVTQGYDRNQPKYNTFRLADWLMSRWNKVDLNHNLMLRLFCCLLRFFRLISATGSMRGRWKCRSGKWRKI